MKSMHEVPENVKKVLSDILIMRFEKFISVNVIITRLGLSNYSWAVKELIEDEWNKKVNAIKQLIHSGNPYKLELIEFVKLARDCYKMTYYELSSLLGISEMEVYDIIFFNRVTKGSKSYLKGSYTREEKDYRSKDMIRMNQEGATLESIAAKYHITKQRISIILKEVGYVPVSTHTLKSITAGKYAKQLGDAASDELLNQVEALRKEVRVTKQRHAVAKYHYNKMLIGLRCKLVMQYMLHWSEEVRADYMTNRKVLKSIFKEVGESPQYTKELQDVRDMLLRMDTFEKVNGIKEDDKANSR